MAKQKKIRITKQNFGRNEVIRAMIAEGKTRDEIAKVFEISAARVSQIHQGK